MSVLKWVLASALEEWPTERLGRWMASKIWFTLVSVESQVNSPRLDTLFNRNLLLYILLFRPLSGSEIYCHFSLVIILFRRRDMKGKDNASFHFTSCTWPPELPKLWSYKSNLDSELKNSNCVSGNFQKESDNIQINLEKINVHALYVYCGLENCSRFARPPFLSSSLLFKSVEARYSCCAVFGKQKEQNPESLIIHSAVICSSSLGRWIWFTNELDSRVASFCAQFQEIPGESNEKRGHIIGSTNNVS